MKKKQVVVIGGGETFDFYDQYLKFLKTLEFYPPPRRKRVGWKANLQKHLGNKFEVIHVKMPCAMNARYQEWELYFNNLVPHLRDGVSFVGHSLGGIFLVKYLHEHKLKVDVDKLILVAAPFCVKAHTGLADFVLGRDFNSKIATKVRNEIKMPYKVAIILHSREDTIVPYADAQKYLRELPGPVCLVDYNDAGHFIYQTKVKEIVEWLKRK